MSKPEINQEALSALSLADLVAAVKYCKTEINSRWSEYNEDTSSLELEMLILNVEIAKRLSNIFIY